MTPRPPAPARAEHEVLVGFVQWTGDRLSDAGDGPNAVVGFDRPGPRRPLVLHLAGRTARRMGHAGATGQLLDGRRVSS